MHPLVDTHAHLDDEQFDAIRDEVIERARATGLVGIVAVGCTLASSRQTVELARRYHLVQAAVGIQPNYVHEAASGDWDQIVALVDQPKVVALGETGLDCYWDYAPLATQQDYFDRHLRLSQQRDLPLVVHLRDSESEILTMLEVARRRGPLRGVMHSFTGSEEGMQRFLELGLHISFAGMVTYKKSDELRRLAALVPEDRLLVETDSPYLSPEPVRGRRPNEPAHVAHTLKCIANERGISQEELAQRTTANARALFGMDGG